MVVNSWLTVFFTYSRFNFEYVDIILRLLDIIYNSFILLLLFWCIGVLVYYCDHINEHRLLLAEYEVRMLEKSDNVIVMADLS